MRALSGAHGRRRTICPCLRSSVCKGNVGLSGPDGIDSSLPSKSNQGPNQKDPTLDSPSPAPTKRCPKIYTQADTRNAKRDDRKGRSRARPGLAAAVPRASTPRPLQAHTTRLRCACHRPGEAATRPRGNVVPLSKQSAVRPSAGPPACAMPASGMPGSAVTWTCATGSCAHAARRSRYVRRLHCFGLHARGSLEPQRPPGWSPALSYPQPLTHTPVPAPGPSRSSPLCGLTITLHRGARTCPSAAAGAAVAGLSATAGAAVAVARLVVGGGGNPVLV